MLLHSPKFGAASRVGQPPKTADTGKENKLAIDVVSAYFESRSLAVSFFDFASSRKRSEALSLKRQEFPVKQAFPTCHSLR